MTTAVKPTTIRIEESLKTQASAILESIGLSYNSYVTLATKQLVNQRKVPFELVSPEPIPTPETHRAMIAAEAKSLGLIPDDEPSFHDSNSLITFLDEE